MILLTGASGDVGVPLLRRLVALGHPVRCLVRDPRRLGSERVRVQIALGDLTDPPSFRNALRGVKTVVHLAASGRDQPRGSIEELNGIATWRLVQAAERAGVEHFIFFSALSASIHDRTRFLRAKALAEQAVVESGLRHTVFAPSLVFAEGDRLLRWLDRLSLLPVVPMPGGTRAHFQPIWADDVAACVVNALDGPADRSSMRYELAGPETMTGNEVAEAILAVRHHGRRVLPVPEPVTRAGLRAAETLMKSKAPATWDEAELLLVSMTTPRGTADAEALGVSPRPIRTVLAAVA